MKNTKIQNPSLRKRKGFTLIELIVVIAILAILAAIAIPTFLGTLQSAKLKTHLANIHVVKSAVAVYTAENDGTVPASMAALKPDYLEDIPTEPGDYSFTVADNVVTFDFDPTEAETKAAIAGTGTVTWPS